MKVIQIEEKRFKDLFNEATMKLSFDKCTNENNHYESDAEYASALREMHRRFIYITRTLQSKLEDA